LSTITMTDSGSSPQEEEQGGEQAQCGEGVVEEAGHLETTCVTNKEEQEQITKNGTTKELEEEVSNNDPQRMEMCTSEKQKEDITNEEEEVVSDLTTNECSLDQGWQGLRERRVGNDTEDKDVVDSPEKGQLKLEENNFVAEKKTSSQGVQLLTYFEAPPHLRFNQYVLGSYRPPMDVHGCLASLTYFHNETINILTHAVPVLLIAAAVPWMLPWDEISVPWLPSIHVVACMAPWVGSTFYHLFMCHSLGKIAYVALLKLDLLGIWFTQTFGALVTISAATHCFQYETKCWLLLFYSLLCFICLYQAMTVSTVWGRRFAFSAPFIIRMCCLMLRLSSFGGGAPNTTLYVILQDTLAILGGYIGAVNVPEKWFPGKCDLLCNSHNIMHVLVVMAVYQMHQAASLDLVWMSDSSSCAGVPPLL